MPFPLKARYLKEGDRINFSGTKWAKTVNPGDPWGEFAGMRRTDEGELRVCFFLGGIREHNFKITVEYDQYFQVERAK